MILFLTLPIVPGILESPSPAPLALKPHTLNPDSPFEVATLKKGSEVLLPLTLVQENSRDNLEREFSRLSFL